MMGGSLPDPPRRGYVGSLFYAEEGELHFVVRTLRRDAGLAELTVFICKYIPTNIPQNVPIY